MFNHFNEARIVLFYSNSSRVSSNLLFPMALPKNSFILSGNGCLYKVRGNAMVSKRNCSILFLDSLKKGLGIHTDLSSINFVDFDGFFKAAFIEIKTFKRLFKTSIVKQNKAAFFHPLDNDFSSPKQLFNNSKDFMEAQKYQTEISKLLRAHKFLNFIVKNKSLDGYAFSEKVKDITFGVEVEFLLHNLNYEQFFYKFRNLFISNTTYEVDVYKSSRDEQLVLYRVFINSIEDSDNNIYFDVFKDNSISGSGLCIELALSPISKNSSQRCKELYSKVFFILEFLKAKGFLTTNSTTGTHIHLGMTSLKSRDTVAPLLALFPHIYLLIKKSFKVLSRRERYCQDMSLDIFKAFYYLPDITEGEFKDHFYEEYESSESSRSRRSSKFHSSRYYALNYHYTFLKGTAEFRFFNGYESFLDLLLKVEFLLYLCDWAANLRVCSSYCWSNLVESFNKIKEPRIASNFLYHILDLDKFKKIFIRNDVSEGLFKDYFGEKSLNMNFKEEIDIFDLNVLGESFIFIPGQGKCLLSLFNPEDLDEVTLNTINSLYVSDDDFRDFKSMYFQYTSRRFYKAYLKSLRFLIKDYIGTASGSKKDFIEYSTIFDNPLNKISDALLKEKENSNNEDYINIFS